MMMMIMISQIADCGAGIGEFQGNVETKVSLVLAY